MIEFSRKLGEQMYGAIQTAGKIYVFNHLVGTFSSDHRLDGNCLKGELRICFPGQDPFSAQSLGDGIAIWRALAFRGYVNAYYDDLPPRHATEAELPIDRLLTLSYQSGVPGDEIDLRHLEKAVETDFASLDALVGSLVRQSLKHTAEEIAGAAI